MEWVREELSAMSPEACANIATVLWRVNGSLSVMSCHKIADFRPGIYSLDPGDIRKFGDEEDFSYDEEAKEESDPTIDPMSYQFTGTDSGSLVVVDFTHLFKVSELLVWEKYDLALRGDDSVFANIVESLGGPCFAVIDSGGKPGMDFDGDGTYTIKAGAVKLRGG
jgi:hypothetical protein